MHKMIIKKMALATILTILIVLPSVLMAQVERFEKVVAPMVEAINNNDYAKVRENFSEEVAKELTLEKTSVLFNNLMAQYGEIIRSGEPKIIPPDQIIYPLYFKSGAILDLRIVLDSFDKIVGIWFSPHQPETPPAPQRNKTNLSLPFKGRWVVFWGGDTPELNQHHNVPNEKYAFDFIAADDNGNFISGEGKNNEDYYAFGKEILVPGDGIIIDVIDGVRDNFPGSMNPYSALGNAVFIKHSDNEISILAHLKQNSIKVKVGDKVKKGQVIGFCGNSGNSSQPHLHYHLQHTEVIQDGKGIKVFFEKIAFKENGKEIVKENYSPVKGDILIEK